VANVQTLERRRDADVPWRSMLQAHDSFRQHFLTPGPYYTNYPTHGHWKKDFTGQTWREYAIEYFRANPNTPLHAYLHVPFCAKLCYYCICNVMITNDRDRMVKFTHYLVKEIELYRAFFEEVGVKPNIKEIHLGGGTPAHLPLDQIERVTKALSTLVDIDTLEEYAIEIDPRIMKKEHFKEYARMGIDRISFGVQDFNAEVQSVINRVQPFELVKSLMDDETRSLFSGFNFDLLYGLPLQTRESWKKTLDLVMELSPERVTLLKYAHVPDVKKHMKLIPADKMPPLEDMPDMFIDAVEKFTANGYEWFGIDNFAKPTDEMIKAKMDGKLGRNFGGYTTGDVRDMIAIGPTATSTLGASYFQNLYELPAYYGSIDKGEFPIFKGHLHRGDDPLRREVIFQLICNRRVRVKELEKEYNIKFDQYFSDEIGKLKGFQAEGILDITEDEIALTEVGYFLSRNVAQLFDQYNRDPLTYKITGP
jgi:oxygen-independent coproporphyrinogen-3 oxidase